MDKYIVYSTCFLFLAISGFRDSTKRLFRHIMFLTVFPSLRKLVDSISRDAELFFRHDEVVLM
jgi:hypothetical protein